MAGHEPCANAGHSAYVIDLIVRYAPGCLLAPGDPALPTVTRLQRMGLLSARPEDTPAGPRVRVLPTAAGYAALAAAPPRRTRDAR